MASILTAFIGIYVLNLEPISCNTTSIFEDIFIFEHSDRFVINRESRNKRLEEWSIQDIINRTDEYYLQLCGDCQQPPASSAWQGPQCAECNCDEDCGLYGDCCEREKNNEAMVAFQCISYYDLHYLPLQMFMKVKCAENFKNESIGRLCYNPPECPVTPVTTIEGFTYINEYCAACNFETNYTTWNITWILPYPGKDLFNAVVDIFTCYSSITLDPDSSEFLNQLKTRKCQMPSTSDPVEQCNQTGTWLSYNQDLEKLCQSSKPQDFQSVEKFGKLFKNIFCYFCNGYRFTESPSYHPGDIVDIVNFNVELRKDPPEIDFIKNNTFFDPNQNRTMEIHCNKGFNLTNGACIGGNTLHQVFIGLRLNTGDRNISHKDNQLVENVRKKLESFKKHVTVISQPDEGVIDVKVFFLLTTEELDLAEKARDKLYFDWFIYYDVITPDKVYVWNETDRELSDDTVYHIADDVTCRCLHHQEEQELSKTFLQYTNQYTCSFVEYDLHDFQNSSDHSLQLGSLSVSYNEYTISGQKIKICVETVKEKYRATMATDSGSDRRFYRIWFIVCLAISLGCLFFTLLTYCTFPSLRSLPCKNNMILIACLMVGQSLLFAESYIGLKDLPCVCYGIAIHYAWLCVTFWMNICSYHMYRVFRSSNVTTNSVSAHRKTLLKYATYANGFPIIIISLVVIGSYFTSGTFGYGKNACYLNSSLLVIVAMVTPLAITITFNLGFLSFTIWSISNTAKMAKQVGKDRHHIWVYIKLSTLTGLFWTISILNNFFPFGFLSYLAVFLNYGQGFFIFLSYMANTRVLNLWLRLCGKKLPESTFSTSSNQTVKSKI